MSVALLLTNSLENSKQKTSNFRAQLHLSTMISSGLTWRFQLHLPPLRSLNLLVSPGTLLNDKYNVLFYKRMNSICQPISARRCLEWSEAKAAGRKGGNSPVLPVSCGSHQAQGGQVGLREVRTVLPSLRAEKARVSTSLAVSSTQQSYNDWHTLRIFTHVNLTTHIHHLVRNILIPNTRSSRRTSRTSGQSLNLVRISTLPLHSTFFFKFLFSSRKVR